MKLLVTGAIKKDYELFSSITNLGNDITYVQDETIPLVNQNIDPSIYDGVICNGLFLYNDIKDFTSLKYIQLTSAGYDRVPLDYINEHNIKIYNASKVYSIPVAELAICGVLKLYKHTKFFYENQLKHEWIKDRNILELYDKNVCILGCGGLGSECAKRFSAFGCNVVGIDLYTQSRGYFKEVYHPDSLNLQLAKADIVVICLPLTDETYHLINKDTLKLLKPNAVLVNVSRGKVVDTNALIDILPNIGGAVLDVFENEPLEKDSKLYDMDNVIITPHNSFVSDNCYTRLSNVILNNLSNAK